MKKKSLQSACVQVLQTMGAKDCKGGRYTDNRRNGNYRIKILCKKLPRGKHEEVLLLLSQLSAHIYKVNYIQREGYNACYSGYLIYTDCKPSLINAMIPLEIRGEIKMIKSTRSSTEVFNELANVKTYNIEQIRTWLRKQPGGVGLALDNCCESAIERANGN